VGILAVLALFVNANGNRAIIDSESCWHSGTSNYQIWALGVVAVGSGGNEERKYVSWACCVDTALIDRVNKAHPLTQVVLTFAQV
jgi:hypothetical protein